MIIIIGILAAIAIPMFLNQRDKAKDAAVKGGTHNIELGLASYGIDNGDSYPAAVADGTRSWTAAVTVTSISGRRTLDRPRHDRQRRHRRLHVHANSVAGRDSRWPGT